MEEKSNSIEAPKELSEVLLEGLGTYKHPVVIGTAGLLGFVLF